MLPVRRDWLLEDSINRVMRLTPTELRTHWMIEFEGEPGLDAGGLMREWYKLVTEGLFNPDLGLWQNTSNNQLQINPSSGELLTIINYHFTWLICPYFFSNQRNIMLILPPNLTHQRLSPLTQRHPLRISFTVLPVRRPRYGPGHFHGKSR